LDALQESSAPVKLFDVKRLKGYEGVFRIRIGDWRMMTYEFHKREGAIVVLEIGPRGRIDYQRMIGSSSDRSALVSSVVRIFRFGGPAAGSGGAYRSGWSGSARGSWRLRRCLFRKLGVDSLSCPVEGQPSQRLPVTIVLPELDAHDFVLWIRPPGPHRDVEELASSQVLGEAELRPSLSRCADRFPYD
jgi:hypothetical protein